MKKALVLAAGVPQAVLAEKLRNRGYYIIMADYTENPVGKDAADKFYRISTLDVEAIRNLAIEENVDLIMTVCTDQAMLTVSLLSEELGLPCYISHKTGLEMTNKKYMKNIFRENGIPSAKYTIVTDDKLSEIKGFSFPMVVKPVDCNSSKGVCKVTNQEDLKAAIRQAIEFSRTNNAIVEEFFEGEEFSCDFFVDGTEAKMLGISLSEKIKSDSKFVIYRSIYPVPYDSPEIREKITKTVQKIVDAYGLSNCPMLVQLLYRDGEISVIEFSARTGGALKYKLIELTSGVDIIEATIDVTLNKKADVKPIPSKKHIRNEFIYLKDGIFDHLEGFEELKQEGIIDNYYLFHTKGCEFNGANSSGDRIGGYTLVADSIDEMKKLHNIAISRMKVISNCGEDMFRRDILKEEF
ncbi:MAG: ATP-grasp domain-containing protein [Ruminococcaceae bacterium]|nr:ATP-grasp domain-containing protein [Oscillospiraceae bacterium]